MTPSLRFSLAALCLLPIAACGPDAEHIASDSTVVALSAQRAQLVTQLSAQKDSLTRVVLQADDFIIHIDSSMSRVKGLPKGRSSDRQLDPLARQIENRKLVMARVDALVERARATAAALAKVNGTNDALRAQLASDSAMITDLNATIQRQTAMIGALSVRVDSFRDATRQLASTLAETRTSLTGVETSLLASETEANTVYYIVGREDDLVQRGVVVREGGTNLLFARPGRTLQVARTLDPQAFTLADLRSAQMIAVPDTTRRYRVVSRQSLDHADVGQRDRDTFRGNIRIADAQRFWAPSKFLVVVEQ